MKTLPVPLSRGLSLSLAFFLFTFFSHAQSSADKAAAIKNLIDSANYVFHAQTALPMSGRTRQLTTDYTVTVTKNKITVDLPYYGQAYEASLDAAGGGIELASTDFNYTVKPRKKDGWNVTIKPKDGKDVQQIGLTISSEGYTSLQVISAQRQPINFNGYLTAPTQK